MNEVGYVYMLADKPRGVICIGVTSDLQARVSAHRQKLSPGFTSRYNVTTLFWYERHCGVEDAIRREKSLKRYPRDWKINLVEGFNPGWDDLFASCYEVDNPAPVEFQWRTRRLPADPRDGARG